jgi:FkbM family methyltransferase
LFRDVLHGTYVDIGANTGQSIESIKLFAPGANVVSFEPNPELADKLERRYRGDPKVKIKAIGLSDAVAMLTLHVPVYRGFVYDGLASSTSPTRRDGSTVRPCASFHPSISL